MRPALWVVRWLVENLMDHVPDRAVWWIGAHWLTPLDVKLGDWTYG